MNGSLNFAWVNDMPKFTFDCLCGVQFSRTLKMGEHSVHLCPSCGDDAPRIFEGFSHSFAPGVNPSNSGVTKLDYPTADQAVGSNADVRWAEIAEREKVKQKVREMGGSRPLVRQNGKNYVQYTAGGQAVVDQRKQIVKEANALEISFGGKQKT